MLEHLRGDDQVEAIFRLECVEIAVEERPPFEPAPRDRERPLVELEPHVAVALGEPEARRALPYSDFEY